jgi:hypothetical protein
MVTQTQRRKLWKSFHERHPELLDYGQGILIEVPFSHFARAICLDGSADKNAFKPISFIHPFYDIPLQTQTLTLSYGRRIQSQSLHLTDQNVVETLDQLLELAWIEMNRITDLANYQLYLQDGESVDTYQPKYGQWVTLAALGKFEEAREQMGKAVEISRNRSILEKNPVIRALNAAIIELDRRLQDDQGRVYELLHEWEAYNVKKVGLEAHWRSQPFPGELNNSKG